MFLRLLIESFVRQRRRKLLAAIAILLGTTAVTAMLALATTIGDRIHRELAVYGANIVVTPKADTLDVKVGGLDLKPATGGAYLHEKDLDKLHGIFWANNITGISPELSSSMRFGGKYYSQNISVPIMGYWFEHDFTTLKTGAPSMHPWWKLTGRWPKPTFSQGHLEVVLGSSLATRLGLSLGDQIRVPSYADRYGKSLPAYFSPITVEIPPMNVVGIVSGESAIENEVLMTLEDVQAKVGGYDYIGWDGISRVEISAKTRPEDAFARLDPDKLSAKQHDLWYCRPYANSIAYQIMEAIPGAQAEQVRQVEQTEGTVLERISGLMWLVSAAALLAAGFAVSAAMATAVLERRGEIGLMRSLGASKAAIAALFYAESGLLAVVAGAFGYLGGSALAFWLGRRIFPSDSTSALIPVLLPVVVAMAVTVAVLGSTPSIRAALKVDPAATLRGGE